MDFNVKHDRPENIRSHCIVVPIFDGRKLSAAAASLDRASRGRLKAVLGRGDFRGGREQTLMLYDVSGIQADRVLLTGLGKEKELDAAAFIKTLQATVRRLRTADISDAVLCVGDLDIPERNRRWLAQQAVMTAERVSYRYTATRKPESRRSRKTLKKLVLATSHKNHTRDLQKGIRVGRAIASGINTARELGNLPGNVCTPAYLAREARKMARSLNLKVKVLDEAMMRRLGMGALLSVSRGSIEPARLIVMEHHGGKAGAAPVVLVGKGLTFDAGGISIKPAAGMDEMKFDMCGGASVFGVMTAIAEMDLPLNVVGIVPSSENLPSGSANKPGDVVTSMSGQTIEILNTDAEGRLILCDALTYAERYKPTTVIDIATLTGACVVALGSHVSGLFTQDDRLAEELQDAGQYIHDRSWRLPLLDDYQPELDSNFADMANVGSRWGGAITAACFLARYTKKFRWAHLDIAGSAWNSGKAKGATGRPVAQLTQFLMDRTPGWKR